MAKLMLGDTVIYNSGDALYPAIVNQLIDGPGERAHLTIFTPRGIFNKDCAYSKKKAADAWHWPDEEK